VRDDVFMVTDSTPAQPKRQIDRTLVAVLIVIGVLVAIALVVVFSRGSVAPLAATSPQGVVQRYATAAVAGDERTAATFLSSDWLASCDPLQTYSGASSSGNTVRVTLVATTERPDSADVHVLVTTSYPGDFLASMSSSSEGVFKLSKHDHRWTIDTAPWELAICPQGGATP